MHTLRLAITLVGTGLLVGGASLGEVIPSSQRQPLSEKDVHALLLQLDDADKFKVEAAAAALKAGGADILPFLPPLDSPKLSAGQRTRLRQLLPELWRQRLEAEMAGSRVRLPTKALPLLEALEQIEEQTGNGISDLREQFNQEVVDAEVRLANRNDLRFWEALDQIAQQAKVSFYTATDDRTVGLSGRPRPIGPVCYAGIFRFEAKRLAMERLLDATEPAVAILQVEAMFEPKMRPILLEFVPDAFKALDDQKRSLAFRGRMGEGAMALERDTYFFPLSLRFEAPPRDARRLAEISAEFQVTLPATIERFTFPTLAVEKPTQQSSVGLRVTLDPVTNQDGVWSVPLLFEKTSDEPATESHLRAALENQIYLEKSDGTRFRQNGGLSTTVQEPGKLGIEYLFVDAPGKPADYKLVVAAPVGLTKLPVRLSFRDLELP